MPSYRKMLDGGFLFCFSKFIWLFLADWFSFYKGEFEISLLWTCILCWTCLYIFSYYIHVGCMKKQLFIFNILRYLFENMKIWTFLDAL